ncbi:MAG: hypothetical protein JXN63_05695 [Candidatus Delongbacteria bacterium]|nr:hypothetical protein [Candidatus Delongbacteria bacterium]
MLSFKKKNQNEPKIDLSVEKLALTNTITLEGLIQVLLKNKLIKQEELLEEIKKMRNHTTILSDENKDQHKKGE